MTYDRPNATERVELRFHCSHCGQRPGDWCLKKFGGPTQYLHTARYNEAVKLRALPLRRVL